MTAKLMVKKRSVKKITATCPNCGPIGLSTVGWKRTSTEKLAAACPKCGNPVSWTVDVIDDAKKEKEEVSVFTKTEKAKVLRVFGAKGPRTLSNIIQGSKLPTIKVTPIMVELVKEGYGYKRAGSWHPTKKAKEASDKMGGVRLRSGGTSADPKEKKQPKLIRVKSVAEKASKPVEASNEENHPRAVVSATEITVSDRMLALLKDMAIPSAVEAARTVESKLEDQLRNEMGVVKEILEAAIAKGKRHCSGVAAVSKWGQINFEKALTDLGYKVSIHPGNSRFTLEW